MKIRFTPEARELSRAAYGEMREQVVPWHKLLYCWSTEAYKWTVKPAYEMTLDELEWLLHECTEGRFGKEHSFPRYVLPRADYMNGQFDDWDSAFNDLVLDPIGFSGYYLARRVYEDTLLDKEIDYYLHEPHGTRPAVASQLAMFYSMAWSVVDAYESQMPRVMASDAVLCLDDC